MANDRAVLGDIVRTLAFMGWALLTVWGFMPERVGRLHTAIQVPPVARLIGPKPWVAVKPPRPYLTAQNEEMIARDVCTITKQRCRKDHVCETCLVCPFEGRRLAGWVATKCQSPTDCVSLDTNVDWERENTNPGWCEGMEDNK